MVDFTFIVWDNVDGVRERRHEGGMHVCTDEDLKKFHPPAKVSKK
jgi:hypothetical protein